MYVCISQQELEDVFKTNFHGPLNITRALLPRIRARGNGTLLYMSSQAGWHADPSAAGYSASKFALEGRLSALISPNKKARQLMRNSPPGAVECLAKELAIFAPGVKVLIIEPGYFRTRAFSNINHVPARKPDYAEFNAAVRQVEAGTVGNEPGDPDKAVSIMIDLVRGTGVAAGKQIPLRVPLGSDGWARIRAKCEETLKICDDWAEVAKSTDIAP